MSFSGKWLLPRLAWIGIWRNKETYIRVYETFSVNKY